MMMESARTRGPGDDQDNHRGWFSRNTSGLSVIFFSFSMLTGCHSALLNLNVQTKKQTSAKLTGSQGVPGNKLPAETIVEPQNIS